MINNNNNNNNNRIYPLTLGFRKNFLPLTEPNPTHNLSEFWVCKNHSENLTQPEATVQTVLRINYSSFLIKGKAVPLQAWSGPEGSRKLRFPDFMTTAQDRGKVVSPTHRLPLPPGNTPGTHLC